MTDGGGVGKPFVFAGVWGHDEGAAGDHRGVGEDGEVVQAVGVEDSGRGASEQRFDECLLGGSAADARADREDGLVVEFAVDGFGGLVGVVLMVGVDAGGGGFDGQGVGEEFEGGGDADEAGAGAEPGVGGDGGGADHDRRAADDDDGTERAFVGVGRSFGQLWDRDLVGHGGVGPYWRKTKRRFPDAAEVKQCDV